MEAISIAAEPQGSLWASLVEAVRGSHRDYTAGSLNRAILLLSVPMVLEMVPKPQSPHVPACPPPDFVLPA